jgi:methyl-accepting chemotaxis protein
LRRAVRSQLFVLCFGLVLVSLALGHFVFENFSGHGFAIAALACALVLGFVLSTLATRFMARGIARVTASTERLAKGDFSELSPEAEPAEFGELHRALDQLSRGLAQSLEELRAES